MELTKVEISKTALVTNIQSFRNILPKHTLFASVIKSNAYGHGLETIAELSIKAGADILAVNYLEEGIKIHGLFPEASIMIMGEIPNLEKYIKYLNSSFHIVVSRKDEVQLLNRFSQRPQIHLKVDSGMGRLGYSGKTLYKMLDELKSDNLPINWLMTHFASTEDFTEHSYSMQQLTTFQQYNEYAKKIGYNNLKLHAASSASTMLFPEAKLDMVRVGISLYGLWPSIQTRLSLSLMGNTTFHLQPVLTWKTGIVHIQDLNTGSYIGYGSTYKTNYPTKTAVIPVGYYEGLDRRLSNQGYVLVRGERAPILGRVCMNMTIIDVTHIQNPKIGEEVVLIGKSGNEIISADDMASMIGTINYDVVTRINPNIPRIVVE
ncbi:MAG: alanine racemase [Leptospiraceae bacterium]|nr:alanine racemase [Leptospiraceae bacterium]MCP5496842.1 alanine racemase [Leptospiraceae bacterium]